MASLMHDIKNKLAPSNIIDLFTKIPKFLLSFSCSQSRRNLGLRPLIVCSLPLAFAFESLPKRNFVKYAGQ